MQNTATSKTYISKTILVSGTAVIYFSNFSPVRTDDWLRPRDGGLSFGGGGRGPDRPCGGAGAWLAKGILSFTSVLQCLY